MTTCERDLAQLGAHVLGGLPDDEARALDDHLASCPHCRREVDDLAAVRSALDEVPPEAFLDGPPNDADLLLARTLARARTEGRGARRIRLLVTGVAAAAAALALLGAGVALGRGGERRVLVERPQVATSAPAPPAGTRVASATAPDGARLTVRVEPATGWVRVNAAVANVPAGQHCRLVVVARDGHGETAGSWLVSAKGEAEGTTLDGSALVAPEDVAAVRVENVDGHEFVTVRL